MLGITALLRHALVILYSNIIHDLQAGWSVFLCYEKIAQDTRNWDPSLALEATFGDIAQKLFAMRNVQLEPCARALAGHQGRELEQKNFRIGYDIAKPFAYRGTIPYNRQQWSPVTVVSALLIPRNEIWD